MFTHAHVLVDQCKKIVDSCQTYMASCKLPKLQATYYRSILIQRRRKRIFSNQMCCAKFAYCLQVLLKNYTKPKYIALPLVKLNYPLKCNETSITWNKISINSIALWFHYQYTMSVINITICMPVPMPLINITQYLCLVPMPVINITIFISYAISFVCTFIVVFLICLIC